MDLATGGALTSMPPLVVEVADDGGDGVEHLSVAAPVTMQAASWSRMASVAVEAGKRPRRRARAS